VSVFHPPAPEPAETGSFLISPTRPEPAETGSFLVSPTRPEPAKTGSFLISPTRPRARQDGLFPTVGYVEDLFEAENEAWRAASMGQESVLADSAAGGIRCRDGWV